MSVELRMPSITGASDREQLAQIRSYLYQFIPQLEWALNSMVTSGESGTTVNKTYSPIQSSPSYSPTTSNPSVDFNGIKALIIKSADIIDAYYEEINTRLVSNYTALSDFGTYTEQTEKLIRDTASFTEETYTRFAKVEGDIEKIVETNGYIRTGIIVDSLSSEEAPKYGKKEGDLLIGVEVGETNNGVFTRFARFTPNRLSFFDQNGNEVAYISNYKLFIQSAEILYKFKIGGFEDTVTSNGDVVTKWVGGNG
jgi:hypothetical protein